jgi:hypothetical protein
MKGVAWGELYNKFKKKKYEVDVLEKAVKKLMMDDDVTSKKGIYYYLFHREEKHLNLRTFTDNMKRKVFEKQKGICKKCGKKFDIEEMEADHITP